MKIQLITGNNIIKGDETIAVSSFSSPRALDDFDVNIIDLSFEDLWRYSGNTIGYLNRNNDLISLSTMVKGSNRTKIVYVYPQNIVYKYNYSTFQKGYNNQTALKNFFDNYKFHQSYNVCFPYENTGLKTIFEPTSTYIQNQVYKADFHFEYKVGEVITQSNISEKITTVLFADNLYATTLDICSSIEKIKLFLENKVIEEKKLDIPEWVVEFEFGNDEEQKALINSNKERIKELEDSIKRAEKQLDENNRFKSILCNNGNSLERVVFEILEIILECDLSQFIDEKREDFLIRIGKEVFIGEIKGVNTNIKNEYISQLDVHYHRYMDEIEDEPSEENVHALLIINPFRTKELKDREPVHESQIALAKRNNSLIIETKNLLKLLELFQKGILSSEDCINIFKSKTGLLSVEDFEK